MRYRPVLTLLLSTVAIVGAVFLLGRNSRKSRLPIRPMVRIFTNMRWLEPLVRAITRKKWIRRLSV